MSNELKKLQQQLERATAAECPSDAAQDAETASLREGWVALGQLLEAAHSGFAEPLRLAEPPERASRIRFRLAMAAAAAASLLVGVTLAWKLSGNGEPSGLSRPSQAIAVNVERSVAGPEQARRVPTSNGLEWDDSLDQQIALAAQEVVRIQQDWNHLGDAFSTVHRGLEEMEEDLDQSPL